MGERPLGSHSEGVAALSRTSLNGSEGEKVAVSDLLSQENVNST